MTRAAQLAAFLLSLFLIAGQDPTHAEPPNIVLVMCDDLGWGDLLCYSPEATAKTPHLDAMAAGGLVFNRFYAAAPVCSPTRGSCLTGRHPSRYGIPTANAGHLPKAEVVLSELLKEKGYSTGHFGKWHLGTLTFTVEDSNRGRKGDRSHYSPPWLHGYDRVFATEAKVPTYDPMWAPAKNNRKAWDPITERSGAKIYGTRYWSEKGAEVTDNLDGDDSRVIMDRAIPFVRSAAETKTPFFATIWFHAPHLPVSAGPPHVDGYKDQSTYERNYLGCITALDEQMGRLRTVLRDLRIQDDTMLWFCSDNGPEGKSGTAPGSAGPFRGRKRSLHEGGVRVPGIVEWPATVKPGTTTDFAGITSDYLPTIVDALDLKMPDSRPIDGISLLPVLKGAKNVARQNPIGFHAGKQGALHSGKWKIYTRDGGQNWALYDLSSDPGEKRDLAKDAPKRLAEMVTSYRAWRQSCGRSSRGDDYKPSESSAQ